MLIRGYSVADKQKHDHGARRRTPRVVSSCSTTRIRRIPRRALHIRSKQSSPSIGRTHVWCSRRRAERCSVRTAHRPHRTRCRAFLSTRHTCPRDMQSMRWGRRLMHHPWVGARSTCRPSRRSARGSQSSRAGTAPRRIDRSRQPTPGCVCAACTRRTGCADRQEGPRCSIGSNVCLQGTSWRSQRVAHGSERPLALSCATPSA